MKRKLKTTGKKTQYKKPYKAQKKTQQQKTKNTKPHEKN